MASDATVDTRGVRAVYNAIQSGNLLVDARAATEFAQGSLPGAQHESTAPWETPEDRRVAVVFGGTATEFVVLQIRETCKASLAGIIECTATPADFFEAFPFMAIDLPFSSVPLPHSVLGGLWLGSDFHCTQPDALHAMGIRTIVRVMDDAGELVDEGRFSLFEFRWRDSPHFDAVHDFDAVVAAIDGGLRKGGVLVHCYHGRSRSATAVIAWLLKHRHFADADAACSWLQAARPAVSPNRGFIAQLRAFAQAQVAS